MVYYINSLSFESFNNKLNPSIQIFLSESDEDVYNIFKLIIQVNGNGPIYKETSRYEHINSSLEKDNLEPLSRQNCKFTDKIKQEDIDYFFDVYLNNKPEKFVRNICDYNYAKTLSKR